MPFELSVTPATIRTAPPLLGEQTDAILAELGYDAAAIEGLRASRVVWPVRPRDGELPRPPGHQSSWRRKASQAARTSRR